MENRTFSLLSYLKEKTPSMVLLDLHWHHQSFDVIETAKAIKTAFPQIYLFLGGFTSSFFHEEIMKNFDVIDGIVRGEAEIPTVELTSAVLQGKEDFFSIPNLTWRTQGKSPCEPSFLCCLGTRPDRLSFTNFPLLKNYSTYIRHSRSLSLSR